MPTDPSLRAALDRALITVNAAASRAFAAERSGDVDGWIAACEEHERAYVLYCAAYLAFYPTRTVPTF